MSKIHPGGKKLELAGHHNFEGCFRLGIKFVENSSKCVLGQ
jgi:hypothetical protein